MASHKATREMMFGVAHLELTEMLQIDRWWTEDFFLCGVVCNDPTGSIFVDAELRATMENVQRRGDCLHATFIFEEPLALSGRRPSFFTPLPPALLHLPDFPNAYDVSQVEGLFGDGGYVQQHLLPLVQWPPLLWLPWLQHQPPPPPPHEPAAFCIKYGEPMLHRCASGIMCLMYICKGERCQMPGGRGEEDE
jgi:hypothetical protein